MSILIDFNQILLFHITLLTNPLIITKKILRNSYFINFKTETFAISCIIV